jgi:hypothetical protein
MRITSLEQEVARYKTQVEAEPIQPNSECSVEELLRKINILEKVVYLRNVLTSSKTRY